MKLVIAALFLGLASTGFGCEVCGCAASGNSINFLGTTQRHAFGYGYSFRTFQSSHTDPFDGTIERSEEWFERHQLVGKFQLHERFQFLAVLPYTISHQQSETELKTMQGLGDLSFSLRYNLVNRTDSIRKSGFIVQIGAGSKLPTGNYFRNPHETTNMFPGTGSWDFLFDLNGYYQNEKWLFYSENSYILKTENSIGYTFGNSLQASLGAFRSLKFSSMTLSPGLGIQFEHLNLDEIHGSTKETFNGGNALNANVGLNLSIKSFLFIAKYQYPIQQSLSHGYTKSQSQFAGSIYYTF